MNKNKSINIFYKNNFDGKILKTEIEIEFIDSNKLAEHSVDILKIILGNISKKGKLLYLVDQNRNKLKLVNDKLVKI